LNQTKRTTAKFEGLEKKEFESLSKF